MRCLWIAAALTLTVAAMPAIAEETSAATSRVRIEIEGFPKKGGVLHVEMYGSAAAWLRHPTYVGVVTVDEDNEVLWIDEVPFGIYGVAAFYDANANGKTDTTIFGRSKEPCGFSQYGECAAGGPPAWDTSAFSVARPEETIYITVR